MGTRVTSYYVIVPKSSEPFLVDCQDLDGRLVVRESDLATVYSVPNEKAQEDLITLLLCQTPDQWTDVLKLINRRCTG
jgi:hypothetical protein